MAVLPPAATEDAFTTVCGDEAALRPGVERLRRRLGVDVAGLTRFAVGSRPVYAAGDVVLKLFPPADLAGCRVEAGVLSAVQGRLPVSTPRVHAAGEHDGWGYVLMSRLPGVPLDIAWAQIPAADRDALAGEGPDGRWRLCGLVDFEPAMRGEREYEFAAVGVFVAEGDARFLTRTLTAYGYRRDQLGPEFRRRLLAWGIVHRYSNLAGWMRRLPEPVQPVLGALADRWFATELARNHPGSGFPAGVPDSSHSGVTPAPPVPGHKAWMTRSCTYSDMNAASTSYEPAAGRHHQPRHHSRNTPAPAATAGPVPASAVSPGAGAADCPVIV